MKDSNFRINVREFRFLLRSHPNARWVDWLLENLEQGFRIGCKDDTLHYSARNLQSALQHPDVVSAALAAQCDKGFISGPHDHTPLANFVSSGLGVMPKKDGSWRLICHLSAPMGKSVNDAIDKSGVTMKYPSVDTAIAMIETSLSSPYMIKIDFKNAFCYCRVHPDDWHLLGYAWRGSYYYHRRLPFGLRSSPWLFNQMADAVEWILCVKFSIRHVIHYLDDFLILASTSKKGQKILDTTLATLQRLGIEWAPEKVQGPAKILTFLGIEIDSHNKVLRLPQSKREDLEAELQQWYLRKKCTKCQLLSLIGKLSFAGKVLPAGQIFIRRLIDLATTAKTLSHRVNLSQDTRANIEWWQRVLPS